VIQRQVGWELDEDGRERRNSDNERIPIMEDLLDDAPVLQAIDRLLRIQERKADLVPGLKAPKRMEVVTLDWLDAQIAALTAEVDARAGELERADAEQAAAATPAAQPPG
jgi:uncharacterized small protein (DUF1192 family)